MADLGHLLACCSLAVSEVLSVSLGFRLPVCKVGIRCLGLTHRERTFSHREGLVSKRFVLLGVGGFVFLSVALAVG